MRNHFDTYDKILADLRTLDVEIADEDKALCLLNLLPEQYDHLFTTLLYGKKTISYEEVESVLSNNSVWKQDIHDTRDNPSSDALAVKERSKIHKFSKKKIAKDQCS